MNELNLGGFEYTFISSNAQRGLSISVHHGKFNEFNSVDEDGVGGKKLTLRRCCLVQIIWSSIDGKYNVLDFIDAFERRRCLVQKAFTLRGSMTLLA